MIRVNGIVIDFDADIPFTFYNPQFSTEISHSLQLTAPFSETNCKAFGYIHRTDIADNKAKELPAELEHGLLFIPGTVVVKFQNGAFSLYFKAAGDFYNATKERSIKDINYGSVQFANNGAAQSHIDACINSASAPYTFPMLVARQMFDKFPVKFNSDYIINKYSDEPDIGANNPTIPFPYLHFIYKKILTELGYEITSDAFELHPELKTVCVPNNYMANEFAINASVLDEKACFIKSLASGKDPEVETIKAHGLSNYQFIRLSGVEPIISHLNNKIYQAEVKDEFTFKLIGADTSNYPEFEERMRIVAKLITKTGTLHFTIETAEEIEQFVPTLFYMHSADFSGDVLLGWGDATHMNGAVLVDPDYDSHSYAVPVFAEKKYAAGVDEGTLYYLPEALNNYLKEIIIANHLPDMNINTFYKELQYLGLMPFVSDTTRKVDIKLIDDILADPEFIDVTAYAEKIRTIENPGNNGYTLQSKTDSNDENQKAMLPVTTIDTKKYRILASVNSLIDLPDDDETNDVRLVRTENAYYCYSQGFLNAAFSWKFLCYNNLDLINGDGDYNASYNVSPILPDSVGKVYHALGYNCMSKTFADVDVKTSLRLAIYHGLLTRGENYLPYASHDIYDEAGNAIEGAQFALRWDTPNGILNRLRSREITWQVDRRKDFKTVIHWPMKYLVNFKFYKKYRISGIDNLVKSIRCTLKKDNKTIVFNDTELARV